MRPTSRRHHRTAAVAAIAAVAVVGFGMSAQQPPLKTPWGAPDLQGIWDHKITTPLERPEKFSGREFLTDEEIAALDKDSTALPVGKGRDVRAERGTDADVEGAYNNIFSTGGGHYLRSRRTSLLIDPPDGKLPPVTDEGKRLMAERASNRFGTPGENGDIPNRPANTAAGAAPLGSGTDAGTGRRLPYVVDVGRPSDNPEDRNDLERCRGVTLPCLGGLCGFSRLVQSPTSVSIYYEMGHSGGAYRTVPITTRPHLPGDMRFWLGDSIGHWEGDTLVVDTTNFTTQTAYRGVPDDRLHMIERFTRTSVEDLKYQITIDKPSMYARPWTMELILMKADEKKNQIFESACYEGNYALTSMLAGARALEREKRGGKGR
jgi:hypothetical protein